MRIGVIGIGGVGGFYGGKLARRYHPGSEHDIVFLCRGAHRDAIRQHGLRVITRGGDFVSHPLIATDQPAELGTLDVALFCVKGYDLAAVAASLSPVVARDTVLIPLGNGVNNDEIVSVALGKGDCLNGCVYISSHIEAPGVVEQTGGSLRLLFGKTGATLDSHRAVEALLRGAEIEASLSETIVQDVWKKFAFIDPVSGVTSLHGCTTGEMLTDPVFRSELEDMMNEVAALAEAKRVGLPEDIVEASMRTVSWFPSGTKSSMQLDVESGRKTELDRMIGYVLGEGSRLGIDTPVHSKVYEGLRGRVA